MSNATDFQDALHKARIAEEDARRMVRNMTLSAYVSQVAESIPGATAIVMAQENGRHEVVGIQLDDERMSIRSAEDMMGDVYGRARYGFQRVFSSFDEVGAIAIPVESSEWRVAVRPAEKFLRNGLNLRASIRADMQDEKRMWAKMNRILGTVYFVEFDQTNKIIGWNAYVPCGDKVAEPTEEQLTLMQAAFEAHPDVTQTSMRWMPTEEGGFGFRQITL